MEYSQAVAYIEGARRLSGMTRGQDNIRGVLEDMGNPHKKLRFIHVAGTNGKGSTCAMLESMLMRAGYKVGMFTSPYLQRFNERFQINGKPIEDDVLARLATDIRRVSEARQARGLPPAVYFEINTVLSFLWFLEQQVDIAIIEVGIGGLLDCTNIITPEVAVVTPIGLDHVKILGNTLEEIAFQKAGIYKPGVACVTSCQRQEAMEVLVAKASQCGEALQVAPRVSGLESSLSGNAFTVLGEEFFVPLAGPHQADNAATAITAARQLQRRGWDKLTDKAIREGLAQARWTGRLETIGHQPLILLDGAHNGHGACALADAIEGFHLPARPTVVCGILNKDVPPMVDAFLRFAGNIICTRPDSPRAMDPVELAAIFTQKRGSAEGIAVCEQPGEALEQAVALAGQDGCVVVCGSLYLVGEIRTRLVGLEG
nr:bifunctional folylpolyglutamate synthase/dihydrofolate synthase [bacterium]